MKRIILGALAGLAIGVSAALVPHINLTPATECRAIVSASDIDWVNRNIKTDWAIDSNTDIGYGVHVVCLKYRR
jgi:hypothetical protein